MVVGANPSRQVCAIVWVFFTFMPAKLAPESLQCLYFLPPGARKHGRHWSQVVRLRCVDTRRSVIERIPFDESLWTNFMLPKLKAFFAQYVLPELFDPVYPEKEIVEYFTRSICRSTCIHNFAIQRVSTTWAAESWSFLDKKGGMFNVTPLCSSKSSIVNPLSAITESPGSSFSRRLHVSVISQSETPATEF